MAVRPGSSAPAADSGRSTDTAGAPVRRSSAGSTFVEVAAAMVVSAIGLLALQSMATAAIRSGGIADWNSRAVRAATLHLELVSAATARGARPEQYACPIDGGSVTVDVVPVGDARLIVAEITVVADPSRPGLHPVTATLHGYSPEPFRTVSPPDCP